MSCQLRSLSFDVRDPAARRVLGGVLGRGVDRTGTALLPDGPRDLPVYLRRRPDVRRGLGRVHFDLTSETAAQQDSTVARALALGASHVDVGQRPEEGHIVLADPEGNEFCVIEAGNGFLADTARIGALSCDGTRARSGSSGARPWPGHWSGTKGRRPPSSPGGWHEDRLGRPASRRQGGP